MIDLPCPQMRFLPRLFDELRASGAPVVVTGAGGWLGRAALEALEGVPVTAFTSAGRALRLSGGREIATLPYAALADFVAPPAFIFHFAFRTRGFAGEPGYIETNRAIAAVLRGFIARCGAAGLFVPSSGAVYGPGRVLRQDYAAEPYGALKLEDEAGFAALAARLSFPVVIMRIFNLAGPCMNNLAGYALGSVICDILRGGPIVLRAARPVWRGYAHVADVLNIALGLLLRGETPPVFDSAGEPAVEIGGLSALAARLITGGEVPIVRPDWENGGTDWYVGEIAGFTAAARVAGVELTGLERQILETAGWIRKEAS